MYKVTKKKSHQHHQEKYATINPTANIVCPKSRLCKVTSFNSPISLDLIAYFFFHMMCTSVKFLLLLLFWSLHRRYIAFSFYKYLFLISTHKKESNDANSDDREAHEIGPPPHRAQKWINYR
jgi:hypothetical protein